MAMRDRWTHKTTSSAMHHLFWCPAWRRRVLVGGASAGVVRRCVGDQRAGSGR
jgi:hypothetical protein